MLEFIGGYDNRYNTSTIAASDAHAMVKATQKKIKGISKAKAESIAASHGLEIKGCEPYLQLHKGGHKIDSYPYTLQHYSDIKLYCDQIASQERQKELEAISTAEIIVLSNDYRSSLY